MKLVKIAAAAVIAGVLLFAILMLGLFATGNLKSTASTTLSSGRSIQVTSDTFSTAIRSVSTRAGERCEVYFNRNTVVIDTTVIAINGQPVAELDEAAKNIVIAALHGQIVVTADDEVVFDSQQK